MKEREAALDSAGERIESLGGLEEDPSPAFLGNVTAAIRRRELASNLVELSWLGPLVVLLEFLRMLIGLNGGDERIGGDDHNEHHS